MATHQARPAETSPSAGTQTASAKAAASQGDASASAAPAQASGSTRPGGQNGKAPSTAAIAMAAQALPASQAADAQDAAEGTATPQRAMPSAQAGEIELEPRQRDRRAGRAGSAAPAASAATAAREPRRGPRGPRGARAATGATGAARRALAGRPLDRVGGGRQHARERGGARAAARLRLERAGARAAERAREVGPQVGERARRMLVALAQLVGRARAVRIGAGQRLVDHDADGPDVGGRGRAAAQARLGRHVRERAEHAVVDRRIGLVERGDAEVEHAHGAVATEQDVGGLDVAVHDAVLVRVREAGADGGGDAQQRRIGELALAQRAREIHALDDVGRDVDVLAVLVHAAQAHDVRVPQLAGDRGLAARALAQRGVVRDRLERHDLLALEVERAEDGAGSAHAEHAVDPEAVADHPGGEQRGACVAGRLQPSGSRSGTGCAWEIEW